jgi:hypothetical protein
MRATVAKRLRRIARQHGGGKVGTPPAKARLHGAPSPWLTSFRSSLSASRPLRPSA